MTRHALLTGLAATGLLVAVSCQPQPQPAPPASNVQAPATRPGSSMPDFSEAQIGPSVRGKVLEAVDASRYTYVRVDTGGGSEVWAAAPQFPVSVGDEVVVSTAMPMQDHESSTLGRTFDLVYFAGDIPVVAHADGSPVTAAGGGGMPPGHPPMEGSEMASAGSPDAPAAGEPVAPVTKPDGGLSVAEINQQADALKDQQVLFRGRVVKFTGAVMGHNWLHVQDGSGADGTNDITVTTDDTANVGDTVTVRGTVVTDQDFGFGYAYEVLVQEASVTVE